MTRKRETSVILTKEDLITQFRTCGLAEGQTICVHTSLSSLGFVVGGAETFIQALLDIVGGEGTVLMPSQTWKNLDPSTGVHGDVPQAWWQIIRENWPAYVKEVTPSVGMGIVAETFRKWPGARRSDHPARSFAAVGHYAEYLTQEHDLSNIFGENSPIDKLNKLDGYVLLVGVGYNKNTSLHLAETRANFHSKRFMDESSAIFREGKREWVTYTTQAVDDADFVTLGNAYDLENDVKIHKVGNASVRFMKQRPLVDWAVSWMEMNRG
ncbi:aminoglycoside N(3)-acetyltransferase [Paenibacillus ferrarius]|uniref:aminoglycoside N(3)-acetyltransferase n=1 Tax=Paenibacillus ferrarius TaxID=1469647 RepID=UPI003D270F4E